MSLGEIFHPPSNIKKILQNVSFNMVKIDYFFFPVRIIISTQYNNYSAKEQKPNWWLRYLFHTAVKHYKYWTQEQK